MIYTNVGYFKDSLKQDPKRRFVSFKFNPSNERLLCLYAPLGTAHMKNKSDGNENKLMVKTKYKEFIDVIPITPCQNSLWTMSLKVHAKGEPIFF